MTEPMTAVSPIGKSPIPMRSIESSQSSPRPLRPLRSLLSVLFVLASPAAAQDLKHKAPAQDHPVAIVNAAIHPVSGPDVASGYILFEKGKITAIGEGSPRLPSGARTIDGKGRHVYPGLIGAYSTIGLTEIPTVRATRDLDEAGSISPEARAVSSINPDSTLIPVARSAGILTLGVFPSGGVISGQPCVAHLDGWTWEEMAVTPSIGQRVNWPQARPVTAWWMTQSTEDQSRDIRRNFDLIDQTFRTALAYARAREADAATPVDIRWEAMRPLFAPASLSSESAERPQGRVFIQANDADQINQAVTWAADLGVRPVIVGGRDAPLCAELLKTHKVPVILTGVDTFPRRDDAGYDEAYRRPAVLHEAGIEWCLASGQEPAHERRLPENAGRAAAFGLPRDAALRAITLSPARILGIDATHGSLEKGKSATLIVTDGDILEISTHVLHAFIDGREIDLSNKQTDLAEKYRERYRQQKGR